MSANVLQRLNEQGTLTVDRLADLFNLHPHSVYPYLSHRELRYDQLRTLIRRSGDPAVARAFLTDLLSGLGWTVTHLPAELDLDGDGDVDLDDALTSAIAALRGLSEFLSNLQAHSTLTDEVETLEVLAAEAIQGIASARQIVAFLHDHAPVRRKARPAAAFTSLSNGPHKGAMRI